MKKILLRLDLNVPILGDKILETERVDVYLPEIKRLSKNNKVIILSHLGKGNKKETLKPVEKYIRKNLSKEENANVEILEKYKMAKRRSR